MDSFQKVKTLWGPAFVCPNCQSRHDSLEIAKACKEIKEKHAKVDKGKIQKGTMLLLDDRRVIFVRHAEYYAFARGCYNNKIKNCLAKRWQIQILHETIRLNDDELNKARIISLRKAVLKYGWRVEIRKGYWEQVVSEKIQKKYLRAIKEVVDRMSKKEKRKLLVKAVGF